MKAIMLSLTLLLQLVAAQNILNAQALPIPELLTGQEVDGKIVYDLIMAPGTTQFMPGVDTPTFGYNG